MSNMIDAVIIDTSALEAKQFDFLGITSEVVPAFYDLLRQKDIKLLSHPVLQGEVKKHILFSDLIKRPEELQKSFTRNKAVLTQIGISPEETIEKLKALSLGERLTAAFEERYRDAVSLGYPSPERIFEDYFAANPPFSTSGSKKSEFPDAFVLGAISDYLESNPEKYILVISGDGDWESTISGTERVSFAQSIEEGIKTIQSAESVISSYIAAEADIKEAIARVAKRECFDLSGYEPIDDVEVTTVRVSSLYDDIVPLRVTLSDALIKCSAELSVDGFVTVIDEEGSFYDPESDTMLFTAFSSADFKNASAEIECEIKLLLDADDPEKKAQIESVKINYRYSIELNIDQSEVEWHSVSPEEDMRGEMMDTLEEYYRH